MVVFMLLMFLTIVVVSVGFRKCAGCGYGRSVGEDFCSRCRRPF